AQHLDLIQEDDGAPVALGSGQFPGPLEKIADAAGADPGVHFYELAAAGRQEGTAGVSAGGPGQQGLAGARGPGEEDALQGTNAQAPGFIQVFQKLEGLQHFPLGRLLAADLVEAELNPRG